MTDLLAGRVHLVGIGGAGMSGIARVLLARGGAVSGSDAKDSRAVTELRALGATVHVGHDASHVSGAATLVVSTAITSTNPELVAARQAGILVLPRAEALAALMVGRRGVAVAGTHGKTTTTSMLTVAAFHCGVDPSFAIGGDLNEAASNAHHGTGDLFIVEADESDGSFLAYGPELGVVTNVEADHLDHYGDADAVAQAFVDFAATVGPGGLVTCADDPGARTLSAVARAQGIVVRTYGEADDADLRVTDLTVRGTTSTWTPVLSGRRLPSVRLAVPGRHLALNSAAALLAGSTLGLSEPLLVEGLGLYTGVRRRMELKGQVHGVRVYDDYAHHPPEVTAQLVAAREVVGEGRLVVAFQPHRWSRTKIFAAGFGTALALADVVVVMEVYAAGEEPIPGAGGAVVAAAVPLPRDRVLFEPSWSAVPEALASRARPGDLVLTLGAGDVTLVGPEVLRLLQAQDEASSTGDPDNPGDSDNPGDAQPADDPEENR